MLNELQHARSEDEAYELEEVMHDGTVPQIRKALSMMLGAFLVVLFAVGILATAILCGALSGCASVAHQPQKNPKSRMLGAADVEQPEPTDSTGLSTL